MNIASARHVCEFVDLLDFDKKNRPQSALVPGHKAKLYKVNLKRPNRNSIVGSCIEVDSCQPCPGNQFTLCYHVIGAVLASLQRLGVCVLTEDDKYINNFRRMKGKVFEIKSSNNNKILYIYFQNKSK